jgi:hypothetical protein
MQRERELTETCQLQSRVHNLMVLHRLGEVQMLRKFLAVGVTALGVMSFVLGAAVVPAAADDHHHRQVCEWVWHNHHKHKECHDEGGHDH